MLLQRSVNGTMTLSKGFLLMSKYCTLHSRTLIPNNVSLGTCGFHRFKYSVDFLLVFQKSISIKEAKLDNTIAISVLLRSKAVIFNLRQ